MLKKILLFGALFCASLLVGFKAMDQNEVQAAMPVFPSYLELLHMQNSITKEEAVCRVDTVNVTVDLYTQEVSVQSGTANNLFVNVNTVGEIPVVAKVTTETKVDTLSTGYPYIKSMGNVSDLKPIKLGFYGE